MLLCKLSLKAQIIDEYVTLHKSVYEIEEVLDEISRQTGAHFSYPGTSAILNRKYRPGEDSLTIKHLLDKMFLGEEVKYVIWSKQIILKFPPPVPDKYIIRGKLLSMVNHNPIQYGGVQLLGTNIGTIANEKGMFKLEIKRDNRKDTLRFQALGYAPRDYSVEYLSKFTQHTIYLKKDTIQLAPIKIKSKRPKRIKEGNHFGLFRSSMYMDTHGQQTALYIFNEKGYEGKLKSVSYYLSGKGNTQAPFRIRLYALDERTGGPGINLLPEILVVKPSSGKGWFTIDLSRYNIRLPAEGLFVGMEGVFHGEFDFFYNGAGFVELSELETEDGGLGNAELDALNYGQQLGYNRNGKNNTWHYSLSGTWFQIDKSNFNVLISAEFIVFRGKKKWSWRKSNENVNE